MTSRDQRWCRCPGVYVCIFFFFGVVRAQGDEVRRNTGGAFSSLSLSLSSPSSSCDGCSISTKLPASGLARASSAARGVCTQHGSRSRRLKAVKGVHAKRTRQAFSRSAHRQPMMTSTAVGCWAAHCTLHLVHLQRAPPTPNSAQRVGLAAVSCAAGDCYVETRV